METMLLNDLPCSLKYRVLGSCMKRGSYYLPPMKIPAILLAALACQSLSVTCTAQESYNLILTPKEVFSETFTDNSLRWPTYKSDTAVMQVQDGFYYHNAILLDVLTPKSANANLQRSANYYKLRVETKLLEGTGFYGLAFGIKNRMNQNLFLIDGTGNFNIREVVDGKIKTEVKGKSPKINTGKSATNILSIETEQGILGFHVSYLVNGSNIRALTNTEQAIADEAAKTAPKKELRFTDEDMADLVIHSLEPKGSGIGIITKPGTTVGYDNLKLWTLPNQGDIIMYKNNWKFDRADAVYLKKPLLAEEQKMLADREQAAKKRLVEKEEKAKKEIAALTTAQLTPPGANGKKYTPNVAAAVWLHDILFQISNSYPFGFYTEKEKSSVNGTTTEYRLQHGLPGIAAPAIAVVEGNKSASLFLVLGNNLTEAEAKELQAQQLVNLCAAAGAGTCQYLRVEKDETVLSMVGVHAGGKDFLSGRRTVPVLIPDKNADGTWRVRLYIKAE